MIQENDELTYILDEVQTEVQQLTAQGKTIEAAEFLFKIINDAFCTSDTETGYHIDRYLMNYCEGQADDIQRYSDGLFHFVQESRMLNEGLSTGESELPSEELSTFDLAYISTIENERTRKKWEEPGATDFIFDDAKLTIDELTAEGNYRVAANYIAECGDNARITGITPLADRFDNELTAYIAKYNLASRKNLK